MNSIGLFTDPIPGLSGIAMIYHANRMYPQALSLYEILRELDPDEPKWIYLAADVHQSRSSFDEYERSLNQLESMDVGYGPSLYKLGRIVLRKRDFNRAEELLTRAAAEMPEERLVFDALAAVYGRTGNQERKRAASEKADRLGVSTIGVEDPWLEEVYDYCFDPEQLMIQADLATERKRFDDAERWLLRSVELDHDNWKQQAMLMNLYLAEDRSLDAAAACREAIRLGADIETACEEIVPKLLKSGHHVEAVDLIRYGLDELGGNESLYRLLASVQKIAGSPRSALESLQRALEADSRSADAHRDIGVLLWEENRRQDAASHFERALKIAPNDNTSTLYLAQYYIESEQFGKAERHVEKALSLEPDNDALTALAGDYFERFGTLEMSMNNSDSAARLFRRGRELRPRSLQLEQKLANALFRAGEQDEGLAILQNLVATGAATPEVFMTLGELSFSNRDYTLARSYYEKAISLGSSKTGYGRLVEAARQRIEIIDVNR